MGRTQDELFAWAARVRHEAMQEKERARAAREAAQRTRARLARMPGELFSSAPRSGNVGWVEDLPIEESAERALMRQFTAEEIANHLGVQVEYVMRAAHERATFKGRPVEDTLRSWFRALLAQV